MSRLKFQGNTASIDGFTPASIGAAKQSDVDALAAAVRGTSRIVARINQRASSPTTTNEQTLWSVDIDKSQYDENSIFEIYGLFSAINSANSKVARVRVNGTIIASNQGANGVSLQIKRILVNRGLNAQVTSGASFNGTFGNTGNPSNATYAIDLTTKATFSISIQLASISEFLHLESAFIRIS